MQLPTPFSRPALPRPSFLQNSVSAQPLNPRAFGPGLPQNISTFSSAGVKPLENHAPRGTGYAFRPRFRPFQPNYMDRGLYPFSCDRCDRSYKTRQQLDQHIAEHVPCGLDGCKFVAHPKIVYRHIQMQHETGLASKIMALNTPEEIAKWREERKKKFPTADNVAQKEAERQEKIQRGELLEKPDHRLKRNGRNGPSRGRGRGGRQFNQQRERRTGEASRPVRPKVETPVKVPAASASSSPVILKAAREEKEEGEIDDDDVDEKSKDATLVQSSSSALLALMGSYASDSEENDVEPKPAAPEVKTEVPEPEVKTAAPDPAKAPEAKLARKKTRKRKGRTPAEQKPAKLVKPQIRPKRLTLLQKV